jgi:poly(3-hydroxybutyrate) depolymerase
MNPLSKHRRQSHVTPGHTGVLAALLFLLAAACAPAVQPQSAPSEGSGSFLFAETAATADSPVPVWYHRPAGLSADAPVVFVMHGTLRNGEDYRDQWVDLAEAHRFLLVVPEFSHEGWAGARGYNLGRMHDEAGNRLPEEMWAFGVIEDVFDEVRRRFGSTRESYTIYGHSAGAQFVHRFLLFAPEARFDAAVPANAGWYTMPVDDVSYPYGLRTDDGDVLVPAARIRDAVERPVVILLGEEDNDPEASHLRRNDQADAQGLHRFERGHAFYETARARAAELGADFNWRIETVPGVGHSNTRMAPAAARALGLDR